MPIINDYLNKDIDVNFIYTPLVEMAASLHALTEPRHHMHISVWLNQVSLSLEPKLLERIVTFGEKYAQWSFVMDIGDVITNYNHKEYLDITLMIGKIRDMDIVTFSYMFLGGILLKDKELAQSWLKNPANIKQDEASEVLKYMALKEIIYYAKHPEAVKAELIDILETYWETCFKYEWNRMQELYISQEISERSTFASVGMMDYFLNMHRSLSIEGNAIVIKKEIKYVVPVEQLEEVYVYLSMFTAPHLILNIFKGRLTLHKSIYMSPEVDISETLSTNIKAISDRTRLRILKYLMLGSKTNKEISEMLNMSPPTVSQHMKILKDSGLIKLEKDKNYNYCSVSKEGITNVLMEVIEYLDLKNI